MANNAKRTTKAPKIATQAPTLAPFKPPNLSASILLGLGRIPSLENTCLKNSKLSLQNIYSTDRAEFTVIYNFLKSVLMSRFWENCHQK